MSVKRNEVLFPTPYLIGMVIASSMVVIGVTWFVWQEVTFSSEGITDKFEVERIAGEYLDECIIKTPVGLKTVSRCLYSEGDLITVKYHKDFVFARLAVDKND